MKDVRRERHQESASNSSESTEFPFQLSWKPLGQVPYMAISPGSCKSSSNQPFSIHVNICNRIVDDLGTSPNARCLMLNADYPWRNPRHLTPTRHPIAEGLSVSSRVPWMQNQNQQDYQDLRIPLSNIQKQIWIFWSFLSTPTPKNWWCKF